MARELTAGESGRRRDATRQAGWTLAGRDAATAKEFGPSAQFACPATGQNTPARIIGSDKGTFARPYYRYGLWSDFT